MRLAGLAGVEQVVVTARRREENLKDVPVAVSAFSAEKLERSGLKTYTQVVDTKDGKRTRVRLGPFDSRAEADKAVGRVKSAGLSASVLAL